MTGTMPSRCWGPKVRPRFLARSVSSGSGPSWSSRNSILSAAFFSSAGPTPVALRTRSVSICSRVAVSTQPGRSGHGVADLVDMLAVDQPGGLGGRGGREHRGQRLTGQGAPRPQHLGFGQAAVGLGGGDAPPDPQDVFPVFGAQLFGGGLGLQPGQRAVPLRGQLAGQGFQFVEDGEQFAVGQHVQVTGGQRFVRGPQRGHRHLNRSRQHDSNIHSTTDSFPRFVTTETKVTQRF